MWTSRRATRSGMISAQRPRVTNTLKMLLPTTLPTEMSGLEDNAACRLTAICGALLPIATTVKPMIRGRTFKLAARRTAARTENSAPTTNKNKPPSS